MGQRKGREGICIGFLHLQRLFRFAAANACYFLPYCQINAFLSGRPDIHPSPIASHWPEHLCLSVLAFQLFKWSKTK